MVVNAIKKDNAYYVVYLTDAQYMYVRNIFPEISGIKALRIPLNENVEIVKIKAKQDENGIKYVHPDQED